MKNTSGQLSSMTVPLCHGKYSKAELRLPRGGYLGCSDCFLGHRGNSLGGTTDILGG